MPSAWSWRRTWGRGSGLSPRPGGRSRATGRSSPTRGAAGWRSSFPWGECCTCRNHQACHQYGLRHPRPRRRGRPRKRRPSRRPRGAIRLSMAAMPIFGTCCSTSVVTWPRISVGQRRSMSAPGLGWMGLVTALGKLARTAGLPTSTPRTCWTTSSGTMRLIRRNGTRRWPCWLALCRGARRGLSRRPRRGPERSRCPRVPALRRSAGRCRRRHDLERLGLQHGVGQ